jgi:pimeloyl-ACP methyl ester carboxylesterase
VRKAIRSIAIFLGTLVVVLLLMGLIYESVGRARDAKRLPPRIGQAVDIGGRTMNIFCTGEGSPTVVFESGGHGLGYEWVQVQPEAARFTRACWYDRAGTGWSDAPDQPRTSATVAHDLHETLHRAGVMPPYVLVGASIGGEYSRVFTAKYPDEVAGLVLADSSHPDQNEPLPMKGPLYRMPPWLRHALCVGQRAAFRVGLVRLLLPDRVPVPERFTPEERAIYAALRKRPQSTYVAGEQSCAATDGGRVYRDTGTGNPEIDDAARASGDLGDRPLIVLVGGREGNAQPRNDEERQIAAFRRIWINELQPSLARLSTRGKQIVVPNAGHMIGYDNPEAIVSAVKDVINQVRAQQ